MRRILRAIGAASLGLAATVMIFAGAGPAAAATGAKAEYLAALKSASTHNVHFVSKATQNGEVLEVVGDTGATSGAQVLEVQAGSAVEGLEVLLIGVTGYLRGNATALQGIIGLTAAQSKTYTNTWLSFPSDNTTMAALVSGLRNKDVPTELAMKGPYTLKGTRRIAGHLTRGVGGFDTTSSGKKVPMVLYFDASGVPRPVEEFTNPGGKAGAIAGTVTLSRWGEKSHPVAPAKSVPLATLAGSG